MTTTLLTSGGAVASNLISIGFEIEEAEWLRSFLTIMVAVERAAAASANGQLHFEFSDPTKKANTLAQILGRLSSAIKHHHRRQRTALARATGRIG